jgi:dTDP-4-dehydrorhamnose 3,5-epimerase-like enzyme
LNDPELNIDWHVNGNGLLVSQKDRANKLFRDAEYNFS